MSSGVQAVSLRTEAVAFRAAAAASVAAVVEASSRGVSGSGVDEADNADAHPPAAEVEAEALLPGEVCCSCRNDNDNDAFAFLVSFMVFTFLSAMCTSPEVIQQLKKYMGYIHMTVFVWPYGSLRLA